MINECKLLDQIFVNRFTPQTYKKIQRRKRQWEEREVMPKKLDLAIEFFRKDERRNTGDWKLFCHQVGFSYSTFLKAFHHVENVLKYQSKGKDIEDRGCLHE